MPAALPANSCRTDKAPALALGKVRPLPRPTTTQAPKIAATDTPPTASRPSPATRPAQATSLPAIIMVVRSEEHTSELQSLMRNSSAVFCLKKKTQHIQKYS